MTNSNNSKAVDLSFTLATMKMTVMTMTELVVMLTTFPVSSHPMPPDVPQPNSFPK